MRIAWVVVVLGVGGCSSDDLSKGQPKGCEARSQSLTIAPELIPRGALVDLVVTWELTDPVSEPFARILVGEGDALEVRVPLWEDAPARYVGLVSNPFGVGAPAGDGAVVARGEDGCGPALESATSFVLE